MLNRADALGGLGISTDAPSAHNRRRSRSSHSQHRTTLWTHSMHPPRSGLLLAIEVGVNLRIGIIFWGLLRLLWLSLQLCLFPSALCALKASTHPNMRGTNPQCIPLSSGSDTMTSFGTKSKRNLKRMKSNNSTPISPLQEDPVTFNVNVRLFGAHASNVAATFVHCFSSSISRRLWTVLNTAR